MAHAKFLKKQGKQPLKFNTSPRKECFQRSECSDFFLNYYLYFLGHNLWVLFCGALCTIEYRDQFSQHKPHYQFTAAILNKRYFPCTPAIKVQSLKWHRLIFLWWKLQIKLYLSGEVLCTCSNLLTNYHTIQCLLIRHSQTLKLKT